MDAAPITKKIIAFGSKQIFLPRFTIALTRTPSLSPYHARFLVPLNFSKFDLRDYLFHAYGVKCHNIRSYVKQQDIRDTEEKPRHFFREASKKYMTVEMETPFVWPTEPEDLEPYGKREYDQRFDELKRTSNAKTLAHHEAKQSALKSHVKELLGWKGKQTPADKGKGEQRTKPKNTGKTTTSYPHLRKQWEEQRSERGY